jgi:outer membrane biosynthesis protein TonB
MSDHERGPYTPPSDRLSFDPREPVRASGPAPVTLIVSAVILIGVVGAVFLVYRHGVRHRGDAPATVGAPVAEMKTPAPPETSNAAPAGLVIDKTENAGLPAAANAPAPNFAPLPEEPLPRGAITPATPAPTPAPAPTPVAPVSTASPQPVTASAPPPPPPAQHPAAKPAAPVTIASLTDAAMAQKPTPKATAKPAAKPATATPPTATTATGAGWVQIGAFSSAALADKGWSDVAQLQPAAMAGKGRKVEPVSVNGKTLYRAYITGFPTRAAAETFCGKLKADGKSCFVK